MERQRSPLLPVPTSKKETKGARGLVEQCGETLGNREQYKGLKTAKGPRIRIVCVAALVLPQPCGPNKVKPTRDSGCIVLVSGPRALERAVA
jgi:hypothetical protein